MTNIVVDHSIIAEAAMRNFIAEQATFTFAQLYRAGDHSLGEPGYSYRLADRLIQKERKAGRIKQTEKRGVWEKVSA